MNYILHQVVDVLGTISFILLIMKPMHWIISLFVPKDNLVDEQYLDLCDYILSEGEERKDRTGIGTKSIFGYTLEFDLKEGFPLLTTKKVSWRSTVKELLWFLSGSTNINDLDPKVRSWWSPWADKYGDIGPLYGRQMTNLTTNEVEYKTYEPGTMLPILHKKTINQVQNVIDSIKKDPHSRRHIISTWNVAELDKMRLPPCHGLVIQFYVDSKGLSCRMIQRSADVFIGLPINIASYAMLTHIIAHLCGLEVNRLIIELGDAHIYNNHIEQVKQQITRIPNKLPKLFISPGIKDLKELTSGDIVVLDYNSHEALSGELNV